MSQFAVFRVMKYNPSRDKRVGGLQNLGAHIFRHHINENVDQRRVGLNQSVEINPGENDQLIELLGDKIDKQKSHLNREYNDKKSKNLETLIEDRIKQGHTVKNPKGEIEVIRHDAVRALFFVLSGSHERMVEIGDDKVLLKKWIKENLDFISEIFGKENIVAFELHIDEKTPHIHAVVVPINKEGRLSASSFLDGGHILRKLQDLYAGRMAPFGLERGVPKEFSSRTQRDSEDYNPKVVAIYNDAKKTTSDIKASNALVPGKLDKVKERITDKMTQLGVRLEQVDTQNKHLSVSNKNFMDATKRKAYEHVVRESVSEELEWIKRYIELGTFLKERGWQHDKIKSSRRDEVLVHPTTGERVIIPSEAKPNGHRIFSYPGGGGGTIIDLLKKEGMSWEEIIYFAKKSSLLAPTQNDAFAFYQRNQNSDRPMLTIDQAKAKAQAYLDSIKPAPGEGFLSTREIKKETYQGFKGVKLGADKLRNNVAVFPLYKNFDKVGNADLSSTITYKIDRDGNRRKAFQAGLERGLSVLIDANTKLHEVERIVITESPVDALSYKQLDMAGRLHANFNPQLIDKTAYLSTCGNLIGIIQEELRTVFEMAKENNQKVVFALDNDQAGRKMTETLANIAKMEKCDYTIERPKLGKDWNDQLFAQGMLEAKQSVAKTQWDIFQGAKYEGSLFEQIALEKATFESFKDRLKVNSYEAMMALKTLGEEKISSLWHIELSADRKWKESLEGAPELSVLKGDIKGDSTLMLVTNPLDALIHYQAEKNDKICYVFANPEATTILTRPLLELVEQENWNSISVISRSENDQRADMVEAILKGEKYVYDSTPLDLVSLINKSAEELGISKETAANFNENKTLEIEDQPGNRGKIGDSFSQPIEEPKENKTSEEKEKTENHSILSTVYGDIKHAKKVILVSSKVDAMLHYEASKKQGGAVDNTCYVLADTTDKSLLKEPVRKLKEFAKRRDIEVDIVASKGNMYVARDLKYAFKEESARIYNERLKKELPLSKFLQEEMGWKIDIQNKDEHKDVLIHPKSGEKINIPNEPKKNGHWAFTYDQGGGGGTIIDLLLEEKMDWYQIVKLAERQFLPKIEVVEQPNVKQSVSNDDKLVNNSRTNIFNQGISLLSSLMRGGCSGYHDIDDEDDLEEKEKWRKTNGIRR